MVRPANVVGTVIFLLGMDIYLLELFNHTLVHPLLDIFMVLLTTTGLVFLSASAAGFAARGDRRTAVAIGFSLLAAGTLTLLFYWLGMRPRPPIHHDVRLIVPAPALPSFPSGHASLAFAAVTVVAMRLRNWCWTALLACGGLAIGLSRVYLGHHYPSDVLAGVVLGTAVGLAAYGICCTHEPFHERLRWLLWPQIAIVVLVTLMAYLGYLPWHLLDWPNADKLLHFLLFGLVAFWLNLWFRGRTWRFAGPVMVPIAILLPFSLALAEESMQALSPIRTASYFDLGADLAGLLLFWGLSLIVLRKWRKDSTV